MARFGLGVEAGPQTCNENEVLSEIGVMFVARPVGHCQARAEVQVSKGRRVIVCGSLSRSVETNTH